MTTRALSYTYDDLIYQYEASKILLKRGDISRTYHKRTIQELNKEQERRDDIIRSNQIALELMEKERIKEQKRIERNARRREQRLRERTEANANNRIRQTVIYDNTISRTQYSAESTTLYNICKSLAGSQFLLYVRGYDKDGNQIESTSQIEDASRTKPADIFYNLVYPYLFQYRTGVFENENVKEARIIIARHTENIPAERLSQIFRDGGDIHCAIDPLISLWEKMEENSESPASIKRCRQVVNKLKGLRMMYPNGVPENMMEEVARSAHRCVVIHDIIGNEYMRFNAKSPKTVYLTNTRENHLEVGHIALDKQFQQVSKIELNTIIKEHEKDGVFCHYGGNFRDADYQSIRSVRGAYAVYNEDYSIFQEFNKSLGIRHYAIQAVKNSELNGFLKESRIIHSAPVALCSQPNELEGVKQMDITKAYTQHKYASYYQGFLGHIHQFSKLSCDWKFIESHVGIYQFIVKNEPCDLLKKLGLRKGESYTLPGPEILYFIKEFGLAIQLKAGAWGSTFEIEYPKEMLENRRYCTWAGKLGSDKNKNTFQFRGSAEWAGHLKAELGNDCVFYYKEYDMIVVDVPKTSYYTTHHILSFITSYTRINMLNAMSKVKGELVKVVLDGLYYRGELESYNVPHSNEKDVISHTGFGDGWYTTSSFDNRSLAEYNPSFDGNCILAGAGGTGKSWSVFNNKSLIDPMYVVPSHMLGRKMRNKNNCNYITIHKLIGLDCSPYRESNRAPSVLFIDELTMMESEWLEKAIKLYPESLFLIAGDVDKKQWYQCRNGHPGQFSKIWNPIDWRYVMYEKDMRSQDDELRTLKENVRKVMREVFTDGGQEDASRMNTIVKNMVSTVRFDDAVKMFSVGDTWIAGTHKTNQRLLDAGLCSGYINKMKEIVSSSEEGAVKRGSFTIHSFQGLTIESGKVFISFDMFEYAMLYTAISRAIRMDQLVFVC